MTETNQQLPEQGNDLAAPLTEQIKELAEELELCYVDKPWAWFTTKSAPEQTGIDWDDKPYQHNAGKPRQEHGEILIKIAYDGPLYAPGEGAREKWDGLESTGLSGHFVSVYDINRGEHRHPWLIETNYNTMYGEAGVKIYAGDTLKEFIKSVEEAGGRVYYQTTDQNTE